VVTRPDAIPTLSDRARTISRSRRRRIICPVR